MSKVERYDEKIIQIDVELSHEKNRRQSGHCQRVEITCVSRGPVVRAEACAGDFYTALDNAATKLEARLRRFADRRRIHRGQHAPVSVAEATSSLAAAVNEDIQVESEEDVDFAATARTSSGFRRPDTDDGPASDQLNGSGRLSEDDEDQPWHIARMKEHPKLPMTVDDALFEMELVGHDFYLFMDKESGRPSVVYRRHAYHYGVITLAA